MTTASSAAGRQPAVAAGAAVAGSLQLGVTGASSGDLKPGECRVDAKGKKVGAVEGSAARGRQVKGPKEAGGRCQARTRRLPSRQDSMIGEGRLAALFSVG